MNDRTSPPATPSEEERLRRMSDAALRYIAPMWCGEAERAELGRRYQLAKGITYLTPRQRGEGA